LEPCWRMPQTRTIESIATSSLPPSLLKLASVPE
jgi:hypothetical protein